MIHRFLYHIKRKYLVFRVRTRIINLMVENYMAHRGEVNYLKKVMPRVLRMFAYDSESSIKKKAYHNDIDYCHNKTSHYETTMMKYLIEKEYVI